MVVVIPLAGCDTYSATCDTDNRCSIEIQGSKFNEFPRPYDASEGLEPDGAKSRIRLVEAVNGSEATIQAGGEDNVCSAGESFVVEDTTITCDIVGDDKVELSSTRP